MVLTKYVPSNVSSNVSSLSVVLSVVPRTIWRDLAAMQKMGILIREGNTSAGHRIVIEPHILNLL